MRGRSLQIRLEVAVIANLFVNLQPIALAVGNDDVVSCRIVLHRCREAETPLRLKALYSAPRLLHIGVGRDGLLAPFRQYMGIANQLGDRLSLGVEDANPMVAPIGDVDIAIRIDGNVGRMIELARAGIPRPLRGRCDVRAEVGYCIGILGLLDLSILAELHQEPTLRRELLDPMVVPVGNVYIAVLIERDPPRLVELTVAFPGPAAFPDKLAVRSEDLQPVVAAIDDDDVVVFLYGQAGRAKQLTIAAAGLAPLP